MEDAREYVGRESHGMIAATASGLKSLGGSIDARDGSLAENLLEESKRLAAYTAHISDRLSRVAGRIGCGLPKETQSTTTSKPEPVRPGGVLGLVGGEVGNVQNCISRMDALLSEIEQII